MAAAKTIRSLLVALGVKADDKSLAQFDKGLTSVKQNMGALVKVAAVATAALVGVTVTTAAAGDEAAKTAKRVNVTAEGYQELAFAADRAGASGKDIETALKRQARVLNDVRDGSTEYAQALLDVGLSVEKLDGLSQDELFMRIAEGLRGVADEGKQVALVQDLWGRGGTNLLPLINDQTTSIAQLRQEARDLGLVMSNEAAAASEEFVDRLTDAKAVLTGLRNTIGAALIPVFTDMLTGFRDWFLINRAILQQRLEAWVQDLARRIKDASRWVQDIVDRFGGWEKAINAVILASKVLISLWVGSKVFGVVRGLGMMLQGIFGSIAAGGVASLGLLGVAAVGAAADVAILALAVEDVNTYLRGGNSLIGEFIQKNKDAEGSMGTLADMAENVVEIIRLLGAGLDQVAASWDAATAAVVRFAAQFGISLPSVGEMLDKYLAMRLQRINNYLEGIRVSLMGYGKLVDALGGNTFEASLQQSVVTQQAGFGRTAAQNARDAALAASRSVSTTNNSLSGDVNINGAGLDAAGVEQVAGRVLDTKYRAAMGAFAGGGV
jgi:hypothetical protein